MADVPHHKYGLLLATGPILSDGTSNEYYTNRIKAALELYHAGKVDKIIASGWNYTLDKEGIPRDDGYDEPLMIKADLMAEGVPAEDIIPDFEGRRTILSVAKARNVYGLDSVIMISQRFHNERAIWQADHYGLKAVGYNAAPTTRFDKLVTNSARELLARVKMLMELAIDVPLSFSQKYTDPTHLDE